MLPSQRRGWAHRGEDEISVARMGRSDQKEELQMGPGGKEQLWIPYFRTSASSRFRISVFLTSSC